MNLLLTLLILTAVVVAYALVIRPWLRDKPWAKGFFANPVVEWMETNLFAKSESLLWARWQQFLGLVLGITGFMGGIDYTMLAIITPDWIDPYLPMIPFILNITGTIAEALRRDTSKPLEEVALPENKPAKVEAAVVKADAARAELTVVVDAAKAKGTV